LWPHWLKLERHGAKYTGYFSVDGEKWTKIAEVEAPGGNAAEDAGVFATEAGGRFKDLKVVGLAKP
jgi:alpha-galactosidase